MSTNVLLTDFGEPALSDFGIAHMAGGFKTATGTFTGSPAFTAPEILSGDPPGAAGDVYGLGATLLAALTGHAAYERRSGEQVVAQFLRIATEPMPDPRHSGIPDGAAAVVEMAMSRDSASRPSAAGLGEELQRVQADHGLAVDDTPLRSGQSEPRAAAVARRRPGNLPLELTSFIGRRAELAEVATLLSTSRLVTVTGIGGVGKTRLALRAAAEAGQDFPDGQVPHYPSKLAREGRIRNLIPNFGIEDRGDGGGVVSLASKAEALEAQLHQYSVVH